MRIYGDHSRLGRMKRLEIEFFKRKGTYYWFYMIVVYNFIDNSQIIHKVYLYILVDNFYRNTERQLGESFEGFRWQRLWAEVIGNTKVIAGSVIKFDYP